VDIRGYRLARFLLTCLIGAEAVRKFFYQQRSVKKSSSPLWILRVLVFQSVFVVSLVGTAYWWAGEDLRTALVHGATAYACVYAYGLMSLALFVATLRSIAEHQAGPDDPIVAGRAALRNLKCGALARLIFGCYGFAEHATHHWQPALPYYHLRRRNHRFGPERRPLRAAPRLRLHPDGAGRADAAPTAPGSAVKPGASRQAGRACPAPPAEVRRHRHVQVRAGTERWTAEPKRVVVVGGASPALLPATISCGPDTT
jgi:hypothetical protein